MARDDDRTSAFTLGMACFLFLLSLYLVLVFLPRSADRIERAVLAKVRAECCPNAHAMGDLLEEVRDRMASAVRDVETMVLERLKQRNDEKEAKELLGISE